MQLIVSLPRNDLALAKAAEAAGADAVKLHMNVEHRASGTRFGSYSEEQENIRAIIAAVKCEVGLMPGTLQSLPTAAELTDLGKGGLQFIDIYAEHLPLWMLEVPLRLIVAVSHDYADDFLGGMLQSIELPSTVSMLEASITRPEDYGTPFTMIDLLRVLELREATGLPLLVPTQKAITPDDARRLAALEIDALMIGAIVTGDSADSIAAATERYRRAIDGA